ncbi:MMPL family transporter [Agromyces neolithicus]|uniref:Efflux RND transporter permease subunit n=1 Tax=Agromyces neolithicus TaxID=269420 RepID=A0ABN2LYP2_9MICO
MPTWLRIVIPAALILVWLALFGAGGSAFGQVSAVSTNDQAQFLPAESEATRVQEIAAGFRGDEVVPAIVVVESVAHDGAASSLTDAQLEGIAAAANSLQAVDGVVADGVSPAIVSDDGQAVELFVSIDAGVKASAVVADLRADLAAAFDEPWASDLTVAVTGPAGLAADIAGAFTGIDGLLLLVALAAVFIILIVVYRSPLLPLIVLGTSMAALTVAVLVAVALAKAGVVLLTGQTQGILFILVIGAATDYSLLYIARYREALATHERKWNATWAALRGAWEPIVASGGTVVAGLLMLLVSELNSNKALGPVAAIGIVCAVLAALTLLPALMLWAGRVAFWPRRVTVRGETADEVPDAPTRGLWPAVGRLVAKRPRMVWITSTLVLGVMALGLTQLNADGVSQSEFVLGASEARDGQQVLGDHFPAGSGTPVLVVAPEARFDETADVLLAADAVIGVTVVAADAPGGSLAVTAEGVAPSAIPGAPAADPTVRDGQVLLQATLDSAGDSLEAEATVTELRASLASIDGDVLVGGTSAIALDTAAAAVHDRNLVMPLVLAVILLILIVLLRSLVAPLLLVASVVLSFGAALGVSALVFNGVLDFPGADPTVPLYGFVFLVALGVDYNIFLMTRVREEARTHGTRAGIVRGLIATGGVITSAGIVLAATFAALGVLPILFLAQIAFIVAFGVILDTVIVRSLLIPALSYDIGRTIWWPSRLARGRR